MTQPHRPFQSLVWRPDGMRRGERSIADECPVALTYDGSTYAVMMATPADLRDFAVGFTLNEGLVRTAADIERLDIVEQPGGIELRMWLAEPHAVALRERRRRLAGPTGCGLCGIESLTEALRPPSEVGRGPQFSASRIWQSIHDIRNAQLLHRETNAVHAAAFFGADGRLTALCEDVGRHNALDKLHGRLAKAGLSGENGFVAVTSRVSIEIVQKTAALRAPLLVAISAPTTLAIEAAEAARITLIGIARSNGFEIFTHPHRVNCEAAEHVADCLS